LARCSIWAAMRIRKRILTRIGNSSNKAKKKKTSKGVRAGSYVGEKNRKISIPSRGGVKMKKTITVRRFGRE